MPPSRLKVFAVEREQSSHGSLLPDNSIGLADEYIVNDRGFYIHL